MNWITGKSKGFQPKRIHYDESEEESLMEIPLSTSSNEAEPGSVMSPSDSPRLPELDQKDYPEQDYQNKHPEQEYQNKHPDQESKLYQNDHQEQGSSQPKDESIATSIIEPESVKSFSPFKGIYSHSINQSQMDQEIHAIVLKHMHALEMELSQLFEQHQ